MSATAGSGVEVVAIDTPALATPGHTFTHLSYVLEAAGHPRAVFTGGSLLYGSTDRPDLLGRAHASELAHARPGREGGEALSRLLIAGRDQRCLGWSACPGVAGRGRVRLRVK